MSYLFILRTIIRHMEDINYLAYVQNMCARVWELYVHCRFDPTSL